MAELKSLQDLSMAPPFVPAGVFTEVQSSTYWSVSTSAKVPIGVSFVHLVDNRTSGVAKSSAFPAWWREYGAVSRIDALDLTGKGQFEDHEATKLSCVHWRKAKRDAIAMVMKSSVYRVNRIGFCIGSDSSNAMQPSESAASDEASS